MFYVLLILVVLVAPIVLSISAFVRMGNLRQELRELRRRVDRLSSDRVVSPPPVEESAIKKDAFPETPVVSRPQTPEPVRTPTAAVAPDVQRNVTKAQVERVESAGSAAMAGSSKGGMEFLMGGKAAAFAGIGILIAGIALLVGYAIQHAWIGPAMRTGFGLLAAVVLVGLGHYFSGKEEGKYRLFAQVLTGGGSGLFYFTVYAAYGFYGLIGGAVAGAGLLVSALIVFVLAMLYHSQAIAVLGVLGAFGTPFLIGNENGAVLFLLCYAAVVNVPVILLGVRRKWQVLYNLAFVFTIIYFLVWMVQSSSSDWLTGLVFALVFYGEYAVLGLLKLRREQQVAGRTVDGIRLVASSLLLLGAVYVLLEESGHENWVGGALASLAGIHFSLAYAAHRILTRFKQDILAFVAGGACCLATAIPAQLDGEWVALGWALQGVVLTWYACRVQSHAALAGGFVLGLLGIMKGVVFDVAMYDQAPRLFLNTQFAVGILSSVLLGVQGRLAGRFRDENRNDPWQDLIWWTAALCAIVFFAVDTFRVFDWDDPYGWLVLSMVLGVAGTGLALLAPKTSSVTVLGSLLLLALPLKILLVDGWLLFQTDGWEGVPFSGLVFWFQLALLGALMGIIGPRTQRRGAALAVSSAESYAATLNIFSLISLLGLGTLEILRSTSDWASTAVTIFWAVSALLLIVYGMKKKVRAHRYLGLVLFTMTTGKVLLVDASELTGLHRIAAFIGTGFLLLVLSFAYQKAAAHYGSRIQTKDGS
jgi:uncharacterized membrane protein